MTLQNCIDSVNYLYETDFEENKVLDYEILDDDGIIFIYDIDGLKSLELFKFSLSEKINVFSVHRFLKNLDYDVAVITVQENKDILRKLIQRSFPDRTEVFDHEIIFLRR